MCTELSGLARAVQIDRVNGTMGREREIEKMVVDRLVEILSSDGKTNVIVTSVVVLIFDARWG